MQVKDLFSNWMSNIINDINSILLPKVCFGCNGKLYRGEHFLCTVCRHDLPFTEFNFTQENAVDRIFYGRCHIKKASSFLYFYNPGKVKQLLHYLKYSRQKKIGNFLAQWFGQQILAENTLPTIDFIVPVPLHPKKQKKRGYNQLEGFGKELAILLNTKYKENALIKTANTKTQTKKNRLNRWLNTKNLYEPNPSVDLSNKTILLIDDVITTGATIESCTNALSKHENISIYVATIAFVP